MGKAVPMATVTMMRFAFVTGVKLPVVNGFVFVVVNRWPVPTASVVP